MGKYRSKNGCITCRNRRVKCDEQRPACGQCNKKNRNCQWESTYTKFHGYRPDTSASSSTTPAGPGESEGMDIDQDEEEGMVGSESSMPTPTASRYAGAFHVPVDIVDLADTSTAASTASTIVDPPGRATEGLQQTSTSPFLPQVGSPTTIAGQQVSLPPHFSHALPTQQPLSITRHEASMVHHYAQHLGRWLDGTDATRQFTLKIPQQVKHCPILLQATLCFAGRHLKDEETTMKAYGHCISLLIERLNLNTATQDEDLLCAIVILRFFEQLNVPTISGSDNEEHLTGSNAMLRASQTRYVDPTAPTLREAAFWVYVRQCLYNSTIDQLSPNVDFTLLLHPTPSSLRDSHPLAHLSIDTAWANQIIWICALVVDFCFDNTAERSLRLHKWQGHWDAVEVWSHGRPTSFDPIWSNHDLGSKTFPEIYFTADCHVISFGYYHFTSILLLTYKPGPKFALRKVRGKLSETDNLILWHARAICGSCKSAPNVVPSLITLCHTVFIWGPLLTDPAEQKEVLEILADFQRNHTWPTTWIVNALKSEWEIEDMAS